MTEGIDPPPEQVASDRLIAVGSAAAGLLPFAGSVADLVTHLFGTPYEQRRDDWLRTLAELVNELHRRSHDLSDLAARPGFVTAVHEASKIALGQHLEAKLEMLKAILLNHAAGPGDRASDIAVLRYMRMVEDLEPEHVVALRATRVEYHGRNLAHPDDPSDLAAVSTFDELGVEGLEATLLFQELADRSLAQPKPGDTSAVQFEEKRSLVERASRIRDHPAGFRISAHGLQFLRWIADV